MDAMQMFHMFMMWLHSMGVLPPMPMMPMCPVAAGNPKGPGPGGHTEDHRQQTDRRPNRRAS